MQLYAYFQSILVIFTFAGILAFLLNYPTTWLQRFLPRPYAATVIFLFGVFLLIGLMVTVAFAILAQGPAFLERVAELFNALNQFADHIEAFFLRRGITLNVNGLESSFRDEVLARLGTTFSLVQNILGNVVGLIVMLVIAYFMLLDAGKTWHRLTLLIPKPVRDRLILSIEQNFLGFFWGRLLLAIFLALTSFIVFVVLKVPQPLLLALIAGVFDLIPGIGATLGIMLISLILMPQSLWTAGQVLVSCIVLQQIEENILMPRIMERSLQMSPVIIFFALLVGHRLAGLFGVFLAIPVTGVLLGMTPEESNLDKV